MNRKLKTGVAVAIAGVFGMAAGSAHPAKSDVTGREAKSDPRGAILRKFLLDNQCPEQDYAEMFVAEADTHGLDWRLLPAISVVESGGGREAHRNNYFGWDNGRIGFRSVGEAIHQVARGLSEGRSYRGKATPGKLAAYNRETEGYAATVRAVMRRIAPDPGMPMAAPAAR